MLISESVDVISANKVYSINGLLQRYCFLIGSVDPFSYWIRVGTHLSYCVNVITSHISRPFLCKHALIEGLFGFYFPFKKKKLEKILNWILNWIFIAVLKTHIILHHCINLPGQDQKMYFSALKVFDGWWAFSVIKLFHALHIIPCPYFASLWPLVGCFIFLLFTNRE